MGEQAPAPVPVAAIDIGSSAVRMAIAEVDGEGGVRLIDSLHRAVNLGRDTFTAGRLSEETIRTTCAALRSFHDVMDTYGISAYRAVATSAVREAENRDLLLDRISVASGLEVEVIEGAEENRLTYVAMRNVMRRRRELRGRMLLVEVGGGNAAITLSQSGRILHAETYQIGAIRMYAQAAAVAMAHEQETALVQGSLRMLVEKIRHAVPVHTAKHFVAVGGDVRFAAAHITGHPADQPLTVVTRDAFLDLCREVQGYDVDGVVARYGISYVQAETLIPALQAYALLLAGTQAETVVVPNVSLRQGLLLDLAYSISGKGSPGWKDEIITSAVSLGEKYNFDRQHAEQVAKVALQLFDRLKSLHRLGGRDRLLLQVAAILHDIGAFVGPRAHHKHSYYLVSASYIFGLSQREVELIANIARYHRRSCPKNSHVPYGALSRESRLQVTKLAALLRIADALDRAHLAKVDRLKVELTGDALRLTMDGGTDWTLERMALAGKGDLFENIYGRHVELVCQ